MKKKIMIIIGIILGIGIIALLAFILISSQNKLIPKIETLTLEYVPGLDYNDAVEENKKSEGNNIEIQTLKLSDNNSKKLLKKIKEKSTKKDFSILCKISINKDTELMLGEKTGILQTKKDKKYVKIPSIVYQEMKKIMDNNNKKILTKIEFDKFTIKKDGAVILLTNETNIKIATQVLPYYKISLEDNYATYDGGYQEIVDLDNHTRIYLYSSKIGYIKTQQESFYAIFPYDLKDVVTQIYKIST